MSLWRIEKDRTETNPNSKKRKKDAPLQWVTAGEGGPSDLLDDDSSGSEDSSEADSKTLLSVNLSATWLNASQEERMWITGRPGQGVVLKVSKGHWVCCPQDLKDDESAFYRMVGTLNVRASMTVSTRVIEIILAEIETPYVQVEKGLRIQVVQRMGDLARAQKNQMAAFIASEQLLVVWEDDPRRLLERAQYLQDAIIKRVWEGESIHPREKGRGVKPEVVEPEPLEEGELAEKPRPYVLYQALLTALTLMMAIAAIGTGWRAVMVETIPNKNWFRLLFALCALPQLWLALFFFQALIGNIAQIVGPIGQIQDNTMYYSAKAVKRLHRHVAGGLPHITIQMPVYKEGLHTVIAPTIRSVRAAIATYELQGGTANIFVNDDGMQVIPKLDARERQEFYDEQNVGWVARPGHCPNPTKEGQVMFNRRGKFRKASNMNYALRTSVLIEEAMDEHRRSKNWTQLDEDHLYHEVMEEMLEQSDGATWAEGNIRIGDYILLIDSDTRVPSDCLLDAVSEMERSPEVAIVQYASGVLNVTTSFFERGITFFTNLVYTQIRYAVSNGDVAPFVGHNAVLRWSAIQHVAYHCPLDGYEKYWTESTVSEDFDMALRLHDIGYVIRLAAYHRRGFKEGVSLTVYDELQRWEKYAYGCNELMFHPLKYWLTKGPFKRIFLRFLFSGMPLPSKFTIMAYIGTYYALGSAWILTFANYLLVGWYNVYLDKYYMDSFKVYFGIITVFTGLGNIALATFRYRINEKTLYGSLWENICWIPMLVIFLGGISLHISQALLAHFCGYAMTWGATAKEVENISFFHEIPRVLNRFKGTFVFCAGTTALIVCLAKEARGDWRINFLTAIWPISTLLACHVLLPFVLNPNLMLFTW